MIRLYHLQKVSIESLQKKEWLDVNGRGGYASSTPLGCHTRKYHGLLVSHLERPTGRFVLLSKCEESVSFQSTESLLSLHKYSGLYYPSSLHCLERFEQDLFPRFFYRIGSANLVKEIMFVHGTDILLIRYCLKETVLGARLTVRPLLAYRGLHELAHENSYLRADTGVVPGGFSIAPYDGMPVFSMTASGDALFEAAPDWYRGFEYCEERNRGFAYEEDLFLPGVFTCLLEPEREIVFCASCSGSIDDPVALWSTEELRRREQKKELHGLCADADATEMALYEAARAYVIRDPQDTPSVVAGYHWFYEWGRDTLISLPGLTFYTGRVSEGVEILQALADRRKNGIIPNTVSGSGDDTYNSVDASLWFFWCVQELLSVTGDRALVMKEFWPVLNDIASSFMSGAAEQVVMCKNGLLRAGDAATQLTWMDATVRGVPVTPRHGCPVEINALWYNGLRFLRDLAEETGENPPFDIDGLADRVKSAFEDAFWLPVQGYLADVWNPGEKSRDESIRPNQIFALSLPCNVITDQEKGKKILRTVTAELFTPYGLRTLSPSDPRYRGRYRGSPDERDGAYHQGTVWPWLIGHYGEALLRFEGDSPETQPRINGMVRTLQGHLSMYGIGHIAEIFDGDYPHRPNGCIAQAWSIAELIRLQALVGKRR